MYRNLIPILLCVSTVLAAPQDSKITYVKRQVDLTEPQPEVKKNSRESRIQNLTLTVPETVNTEAKKTEQPNEPTNVPIYNYSDRIYSIKQKPKKNDNGTRNRLAPVEPVTPNITSSDIILPSESVQSETIANSTIQYETDVTATDVTVTEKYEEEEELTVPTEVIETTKAPTAKPLPKLSHYGKSISNSFSQNLIANSSKRKFRSRCKCEKIWNCTKLQISVPRCPEEYFLCCG